VGKAVPRLRRALALAAATYNAYPEGITWANQVVAALGATDPRRPGYERLAYPTAYYGDVLDGARDTGLDPVTVWSIMRQESLYDPLAVSRADARGLLQLLPATLRRMIREGSHPEASVDVLFRPDVNILLGTRFFSERLREFGGALGPALASYNAGESKAQEWIELADGDTEAVFLECIGYPETYGYLRRIGWIDWLYRYHYGTAPAPAGGEAGSR
jgi:soluble lytic murein transglycosylase